MLILDYKNRVGKEDIGFIDVKDLVNHEQVHAIFVKDYEKWPHHLLVNAWNTLSPFGFLWFSINLTETLIDSEEIMELVDPEKWKVMNTDMITQGTDKIFQVRLVPIKEN